MIFELKGRSLFWFCSQMAGSRKWTISPSNHHVYRALNLAMSSIVKRHFLEAPESIQFVFHAVSSRQRRLCGWGGAKFCSKEAIIAMSCALQPEWSPKMLWGWSQISRGLKSMLHCSYKNEALFHSSIHCVFSLCVLESQNFEAQWRPLLIPNTSMPEGILDQQRRMTLLFESAALCECEALCEMISSVLRMKSTPLGNKALWREIYISWVEVQRLVSTKRKVNYQISAQKTSMRQWRGSF